MPTMATIDDVVRLTAALPEVTEGERARQPHLVRRGQGLRMGATVQQGGHPAFRRGRSTTRTDPRSSCRGSHREGGRPGRLSKGVVYHPPFRRLLGGSRPAEDA